MSALCLESTRGSTIRATINSPKLSLKYCIGNIDEDRYPQENSGNFGDIRGYQSFCIGSSISDGEKTKGQNPQEKTGQKNTGEREEKTHPKEKGGTQAYHEESLWRASQTMPEV